MRPSFADFLALITVFLAGSPAQQVAAVVALMLWPIVIDFLSEKSGHE